MLGLIAGGSSYLKGSSQMDPDHGNDPGDETRCTAVNVSNGKPCKYKGKVRDEQGNLFCRRHVSTAECPICLDAIRANNGGLRLECQHSYHRACLKKWIGANQRPSCPMCRTDISKAICERLDPRHGTRVSSSGERSISLDHEAAVEYLRGLLSLDGTQAIDMALLGDVLYTITIIN